jgi:hypothetical protein
MVEMSSVVQTVARKCEGQIPFMTDRAHPLRHERSGRKPKGGRQDCGNDEGVNRREDCLIGAHRSRKIE